MYLALFLVAILYLYVTKEEKSLFFKYGVLSAILVLFPVTGWVVNRYFQGFYNSQSRQWIIPVLGMIAYAVMEIYGKQWEKWKKRLLLPSVCLVIVLCGFLSHSYLPEKEMEREQEIEDIYELVLENSDERQILLVAPKEIMESARGYDGRLLTAYGRDIWEQDLDYAFYGNYEEWAYGLSEHMNEPFEENEALVLAELSRSGATHVIFDKENLTFGEDMQYPFSFKSDDMKLEQLEETRHYVIYARVK